MKIYLGGLIALLLSLGLLLILLTQHHLVQMKARGELVLCLKEVKGELHKFVTHTEKLNWAIKHIDKAKYLIFIPGLQAVAANSERAKKLVMGYQDFTLAQYLMKLTKLQKRCPQTPLAFMTPYQIGLKKFHRRFDGTTYWRKEWKTQIKGKFETAYIQIKEKKIKQLEPQFQYQYSIKRGSVFSLLPSLSGSLPSLSAHTSI